jgi:hypothetical protein
MSFQIQALDPQRFEKYFSMSQEQLARHNAVRIAAAPRGGLPCRVSLADSEVGEDLVLVNFEHQPGASPYRAAHAIYVRRGVAQGRPAIDEIPPVFKSRTLSLRAFDDRAMIVGGALAEGANLAAALDRLLVNPDVAYVHIHYAEFGCYAARATRVSP